MIAKRIMLITFLFIASGLCTFTKADVSAGVLWSTQEPAYMPNIQGSVSVWEDAGWEAYVDTYFAIDLSSAGAGISVSAPPSTPVFSTFLSVLEADRVGPAFSYSFDDGSWGLNIVCIYEIR